MSGYKDNKMGWFFSPHGKVDPFEESMFASLFDDETDYEILEIENNIKEFNLYRKLAIVKTLNFPFEIFWLYLFLGKKYSDNRWETQKLYNKIIKRKINLEEFRKELTRLVKEPT